MRIKTILRQHRRDFTAIYECEHCGAEEEDTGYDDKRFHDDIIPDMICGTCKSLAPASYKPRTPRYPEGYQI